MDDDPVIREFFASFAEHLVPEAFETRTRADRVTYEASGPMGTGGPESRTRFDGWIDARLEDALAASWPRGRPLAVVFTSDGQLLRCYHHDGCGHFDWFLKRVRDEAAAIETPWVFGAALPRPHPVWELLVDDDGNEIDEILRPPSSSRWTATWYAEARGGGIAATVAGCLHLDGEQVTCRAPLDVRETAATRAFHRMLYGHPARRRHPLRRSAAGRDVVDRRIR